MLQRKLALKMFLESAGYMIFVQELQTYYDGASNRVINKYKGSIALDGLSALNYDLGEKSGLGKVLNILDNYKEELEDNSSSQTLTDNEVTEK